MAKQPIFRENYVRHLYNNVKNGTGLRLYKNLDFKYETNQLVHLPNIEQPENLVEKLNPSDDFESAIVIYEAYCNLLPIQAADNRLWTYLSHADLYSYMIKRWDKFYNGDIGKDYILDHWFLNSTSQSSLMRHAISGLWWGVHLSVDDALVQDKYRLTRILFRQLDFLTRTLGLYLLARHKEAVMGILEFIDENEELFNTRFQEKTRYIIKHLNLIGGVKPLAYYEKEFFKVELMKIMPQIENM